MPNKTNQTAASPSRRPPPPPRPSPPPPATTAMAAAAAATTPRPRTTTAAPPCCWPPASAPRFPSPRTAAAGARASGRPSPSPPPSPPATPTCSTSRGAPPLRSAGRIYFYFFKSKTYFSLPDTCNCSSDSAFFLGPRRHSLTSVGEKSVVSAAAAAAAAASGRRGDGEDHKRGRTKSAWGKVSGMFFSHSEFQIEFAQLDT